MPELELIVERLDALGAGAARIPGWASGHSLAVISWRGLDGGGQGPFTREYTSMTGAVQAMSDIDHYVNLELVSARLIVEEHDMTGTVPEPPLTLRSALITLRSLDLDPQPGYPEAREAAGMAIAVCALFGLGTYALGNDVETVYRAITGSETIERAIEALTAPGPRQ